MSDRIPPPIPDASCAFSVCVIIGFIKHSRLRNNRLLSSGKMPHFLRALGDHQAPSGDTIVQFLPTSSVSYGF